MKGKHNCAVADEVAHAKMSQFYHSGFFATEKAGNMTCTCKGVQWMQRTRRMLQSTACFTSAVHNAKKQK